MDFFMNSVKPRLENDECNLDSAHVGQEMHSLVFVDTNLPLVAIVPSFGKYLQFKVNICNTHVAVELVENQLSFIPLIRERNRKDTLYNKIIEFFKSSGVGLLEGEMHLGLKLVACLRDVFWYLDGHHHVFERINRPLSSAFSSFVGYNVPELYKHRKRMTRNISSDKLREFSLDLSTILFESYWERNCWSDIKHVFTSLTESLTMYSDHLIEKNKKIKENHRSPTPVRELSDNLHLKLISPSQDPVSLQLVPIDSLLESLPVYKYSSIDHLLPLDSLKKHRLINSLISSGLSSPSMLLVYCPGGSIRNLQFLWRLPQEVDDPNTFFEHSQPVVEDIKKVLPSFHTRAMRKAMFQKFGRVSSGIKPSVLRFFYKELTGK
jgi:hypothetical protein